MERLNRNNFNSHAHVERDRPNTKRFLRLQISTHTLTWSVTIYAVMKCIYVQDFNSHAHVERDAVCEQEIKGYFNFNSHAHVERDTHFTALAL